MKRKFDAEKDLSNNVKGYVQQVSPVKKGNTTTFFDGYIQTDTNQYKRFVCFDKDKHDVLHLAASNKRPLKFTDVKEVPSRIDSTKTDILVNTRSKVEVAKLDFMHSKKDKDDINARLTVQEIQKIPEKTQISAILAKVVKEKPEAVQDVRGTLIKKKDIIIADSSGSIKLALWDALVNKIQLEKTYLFKNVSTRSYFNKKYITATPSTVAEEQQPLQNVVEPGDDDDDTNITKCGKISQIRINITATCQSCKKRISAESGDIFTRCTNCHMKVKVKDLLPTLNASVLFVSDDNNFKLVAYHAALSNFCTIMGKEEFRSNTDLFEEYLLEQNNIEMNFDDNNVISKMSIKA